MAQGLSIQKFHSQKCVNHFSYPASRAPRMSQFQVKVLRRADSKGFPDDFDLTKGRYGFGVSWDQKGGRDVDIDLQCVVVDNKGVIVDCAYYNNLKAPGITHSGDESRAKPHGIEELVWVTMRKVPANVQCLVFVVAAYSGGSLNDVANGMLHILSERESDKIAEFEMERSSASVDVVGVMFRDGAQWKFRIIDEPAQSGQHFMDILPLLSQTIRVFIPSAPTKQKVAFAMEKGGILDLPQNMGKITVGLGWDVDDGEVDLDVSAVLFDKNGTDLEAVFFGRLESEQHGIQHSGDNLTGEGDGDDEQISLDLDRIGPEVHQVMFVVNIYTGGKNFTQVAAPYCRVVDDTNELCRYALRDAGRENGLIVAKIAREAGDRWGFHALGLPCKGRTYKDSVRKMREICDTKTSSLVLHTQITMDSFGDPPLDVLDPPARLVGHRRREEKSCCVQ
uniref:TerD domain-containing protein n=1 Tax=Noctiluca scintillans TaxID=2966 RepID=A0A7S1EXT5_NOCSC